VHRRIQAPAPATAGFILADAAGKLIYTSPEAKRILTWPRDLSEFQVAWTSLRKRTVPPPAKQNGSSSANPHDARVEFASGRRRYACLSISLTESLGRRPAGAAVAIVLERSGAASHAVAEVSEHFHLTGREREVVEFLIQGLTNKQIAARMNISPNTVRSFVRMVMGRLGISTRSGIVGVVFRGVHTPPGQPLAAPRRRRSASRV
jgi:DNA-binding CsgD family transcriptional regulator